MDKQLTKDDFYYCYDKLQMRFLYKQCGIPFIICAYHESTQSKFYMFQKGEILQSGLDQWRKMCKLAKSTSKHIG